MTFKAILHALVGGLKFIDVTQNFKIFIRKNVAKFARLSSNLESYLHSLACLKSNMGGRGGCFLLINKLQPKLIYICPDR